MPSGTTVTATHSCITRGECYLDVKVYALSEDMDNSEGLCGNFNGERDDDLPGGSSVDEFNLEPIEFIKSFMSVARFLHLSGLFVLDASVLNCAYFRAAGVDIILQSRNSQCLYTRYALHIFIFIVAWFHIFLTVCSPCFYINTRILCSALSVAKEPINKQGTPTNHKFGSKTRSLHGRSWCLLLPGTSVSPTSQQ